MADKIPFGVWMRRVDAAIETLTGGLSSGDIDDWRYADAYADGVSVTVAARAAVRAAKKACGL